MPKSRSGSTSGSGGDKEKAEGSGGDKGQNEYKKIGDARLK